MSKFQNSMFTELDEKLKYEIFKIYEEKNFIKDQVVCKFNDLAEKIFIIKND